MDTENDEQQSFLGAAMDQLKEACPEADKPYVLTFPCLHFGFPAGNRCPQCKDTDGLLTMTIVSIVPVLEQITFNDDHIKHWKATRPSTPQWRRLLKKLTDPVRSILWDIKHRYVLIRYWAHDQRRRFSYWLNPPKPINMLEFQQEVEHLLKALEAGSDWFVPEKKEVSNG
jgi:hypothetical protein